MSRRVPWFASRGKPEPSTFGEPQFQIIIEVDERGLMRTSINKPLPAVQIIGLLLDSMQGQYQAMVQQASLLINPKGEPAHGGEKEENDDSRRGDTGGGEPIS